MSSHSNNNLATIQGQKCFCQNFGIQVGGCKTTVEAKEKEGHLRALTWTQVVGL